MQIQAFPNDDQANYGVLTLRSTFSKVIATKKWKDRFTRTSNGNGIEFYMNSPVDIDLVEMNDPQVSVP